MTSYVKKRNCCFLQKSKKFFESITQNVNETLDIVKEFTIKGEYCELKYGDFQRLYGMRNAIRKVIVGWAKHTQEKLNSEVVLYTGYSGVDPCHPDVESNGLRFTVRLYTVGENLEARAVPMFTLSDKVGHAFALGDFDCFYAEYESNPDILVEDISEFLLSINKLERFITTLSQPNCYDNDVVGFKVPNFGPTKSMVALPYSHYVEQKYCKPHEIEYHYKHPHYHKDYSSSRYSDTYTDSYSDRHRRHRRHRRRHRRHRRHSDEDSYYDSSIYHSKHNDETETVTSQTEKKEKKSKSKKDRR